MSCQGQTKVSNKCVGALCSQISYNVLHIKEEGYNVGSHPHRQPYDSPVLVNENGGYQMSWKILYMSWKIDPFSQGRGIFQISWAHKFVYAFLPFCTYRNGSSESKSASVSNYYNNLSTTRQTMVFGATKNVCGRRITSINTQRSTQRSCRKVTFICNAEFTATSVLDILR